MQHCGKAAAGAALYSYTGTQCSGCQSRIQLRILLPGKKESHHQEDIKIINVYVMSNQMLGYRKSAFMSMALPTPITTHNGGAPTMRRGFLPCSSPRSPSSPPRILKGCVSTNNLFKAIQAFSNILLKILPNPVDRPIAEKLPHFQASVTAAPHLQVSKIGFFFFTAFVTNYHRCVRLMKQRFIFLQFCSLAAPPKSHWAKTKVSTGLCYVLEALGDNPPIHLLLPTSFHHFPGPTHFLSICKVNNICFSCHSSRSHRLLTPTSASKELM